MAGLLSDVLPYLYSRGDAAKRFVGGLLGDPAGMLAREVNYANDRAGGLLAQTRAATDEGMSYGPATQRLAGTLADSYNPIGMALMKTDGLPNRGKDLIQGEADRLAEMLRAKGFSPEVTHSGSVAGPSSYVRAYDPTTGRVALDNLRLSGHSKGPYESQFVRNVDPTEFDALLQEAQTVRNMGPSSGFLARQQRAARAAELEAARVAGALERAMAKVQTGEKLSRAEDRAYQAFLQSK